MNRHDDLPLFQWSPPECVVLAFPQSKRIGKVRRTAETLIGSTAKQEAHFRRQIFEGVMKQLLAGGVAHVVAEREMCAFIEAVDREISRRTRGQHWRMPDSDGGAA